MSITSEKSPADRRAILEERARRILSAEREHTTFGLDPETVTAIAAVVQALTGAILVLLEIGRRPKTPEIRIELEIEVRKAWKSATPEEVQLVLAHATELVESGKIDGEFQSQTSDLPVA